MFTCPNCMITLQTVKGCGGVYWECPTCGGRSATIALLRKFIPRELVNKFWQDVRGGTHPQKRNCPACLNPMSEVAVPGQEAEHLIDVCVRCQFVWFDRNEFSDLPQLEPVKPPEDELPQEARQKLAILEVKQMAESVRIEEEDSPPESWWQYLAAFVGLPVEVEDKGWSRFPLVTAAVAVLILLVSLIAMSNLDSAITNFGLIPNDCWRLHGLTFLTSFLLHGGYFHLFANLYFLLVFGDNVEEYLGRARYLLLIIIASLVGDVLHVLGAIDSTVPVVGASGGISGIIAFYACEFPHAKLALMFRYGAWIRWTRISAAWMFGAWIGIQVLGIMLDESGAGGVAYRAHFGGAFVGVFFWLLMRSRKEAGILPNPAGP